MHLTINEIFSSIQGESTWVGLPTTFIRLTGCNLRCTYCDTQYAYKHGRQWSFDELLPHLKSLGWKRLCVTGGEPLLQKETPAFITRLLDHGFKVSLETNGSLIVNTVDSRCAKIVDFKCPSSGMQSRNRFENVDYLNVHDQVKFVIADLDDFHYACHTANTIARHLNMDRILFSPVYGKLAAEKLAKWILEGRIGVRLQIQLHKFLWSDKDRGV